MSKQTKKSEKKDVAKVAKTVRVKVPPHMLARLLKESILPQLRALHAKRAAVMAEKAAFDLKYVSVDVKGQPADPFKVRMGELDQGLMMLRKSALSLMGTNRVMVPMVEAAVFASTVTTGVVNGVIALNAAAFTDFSVFASLFEEYKIHKGRYSFTYGVPFANNGTGAGNAGVTLLGLGFSFIATAATSVVQVCDDAQHALYLPPIAVITISGSTDGAVSYINKLEHFDFKCPSGVLDDTTLTGPGSWLPVTDTSSVYGYIRTYGVTALGTVIPNAVNGILRCTFEFRLRV